MEKSKNKKKIAKILVIVAIILILVGILIALLLNRDKEEKIYYATFIVDGVVYKDAYKINKNGYISTLPPSPTKDGYVFDHWEINGKEYPSNEKITSDVTLVAVFKEREKVMVTFNKDNGEKSTTKTIYKYEKVTAISNPKKTGYEFIGWYLDVDDEYGEDELFSFDTEIVENITLIAKWEPLVYIITFESNGGSNVNSKVVDYKNKVKVPNEPTREGYKFLGWYLNDKKYDFNTKVTKDMTLVAKWEVASYVIKFDSNGGTNIDNQLVNHNDKIIKPTNPTKEGYKFIEWTLEGKTYDFDNLITSDITLVAEWKEVEIKITYGDVNEDGIIDDKDSLKLQQYLNNEITLDTQSTKNADVNADGNIDNIDYDLLIKYISENNDGAVPTEPLN